MANETAPDEPVKICVQSPDTETPNRTFPGVIEDLRKKQLLLLADEDVQVNAQISAQTKHLLYMGRVLNSFPRPDGKWDIAVTVNRKLGLI